MRALAAGCRQIATAVVARVHAATSAEQMKQAVQIADVEWFDVLGNNATLYNSPIVSRSTKAQIDGEFFACVRIRRHLRCPWYHT